MSDSVRGIYEHMIENMVATELLSPYFYSYTHYSVSRDQVWKLEAVHPFYYMMPSVCVCVCCVCAIQVLRLCGVSSGSVHVCVTLVVCVCVCCCVSA